MHRYLIRRLLLTIPVLLGVATLVFSLIHFIPGDPAQAMLGEGAAPEDVAQLRERLGLDRPLLVQYGSFLKGLTRGDLGVSLRNDQPVTQQILERMPATAELALASMAVAVVIALPLGIIAAVWRGTAIDHSAMTLSLVGISVPNFWLGPLLAIVFAVELGWLPVGGRGTLAHLVLPALTLAMSRAAVLGRLTRAAVLDVVQRGFVQYARAKGLAERAVLLRHVLPNAAIPIVTVLGLQVGYMLGGAIVVEMIFTLPGVGRMTLDAVLERNYPVVQSTVLVIGAMFMLVNLATDILYGVIDPRVRRR
jgi:peptide/nickel transport system permease protein